MKSSKAILVAVAAVVVWANAWASAQSLPVTHNIAAWFRGGAGVTTNGSGEVIRWADQSGNGNDAWYVSDVNSSAPDYVANGLNGLPLLRFDGVYDHLRLTNATLNLTSGLSIFIVAKNDYRKNFQGLFKIGPSGSPFNGTSDLEIYWQLGSTDAGSGNAVYIVNRNSSYGDKIFFDAPPAVGQYYLYDVIAGSTTATQRLNGVTGDISEGSYFLPANANSAFIGVGYGGLVDSLDGDIAEVLVYDATLTADERGLVASRLADKYGLSIPEPSCVLLIGLGGLVFSRLRKF